jgi:hypothetical protein
MPDKEKWEVKESPAGRIVLYSIFDDVVKVCRLRDLDYAKRITVVPDAADAMERLLEQAKKWGPPTVRYTDNERRTMNDASNMIKRLRGK